MLPPLAMTAHFSLAAAGEERSYTIETGRRLIVRYVRVRGASKVMCHCMFGVLALTTDQLVRLVT